MADVFLSYSRTDADLAERLARSLQKEGWSVWWDPAIRPHEDYSKVIDEEIEAALVVLVLWSAKAAESPWVRSEASFGLEEKKLVQARIDEARLPRPFDQFQAADLSDWDGYTRSPQRWALSDSIRTLAAHRKSKLGAGKPRRSRHYKAYRKRLRGRPRLAPIAAVLLVLTLGAGAWSYAQFPWVRGLLRYGGAIQVNVAVTVNAANVQKVGADVQSLVEADEEGLF